nr:MAG TPA: hypothetical protein [Caudoviricetes sp.]DAR94881.1 MAG TPA: hypothetical protein [Caudoviricetes sp.]
MLNEPPEIQNYGEVDMTILQDVKSVLDFASEEDTGFDSRLIMELDGVIGELSQLVQLNSAFEMTAESKWEQLLNNSDAQMMRLIKQYVYLNIRIKFDPPFGSVLTSLEKSLQSTAHRIIIQKEDFNEPK